MIDHTEQLTAYIDGELSEAETAELETRLAQDSGLRAQADKLRSTVNQLKLLAGPTPSPELRRAVLARIDEPTWRESIGAWLAPGRLIPLGVVTAAGLAAVIAWQPKEAPVDSEEQLLVAQNYEMLEDLEVLGLEGSDDVEVVASLHDLEVKP